jgi:chaperonin GroEL
VQKETGHGLELLDSGGTIARRIIQIQDPDADMGAMLTRQMLWQLHEKVGDGTATAAVIFQKIYNEGLHFLVSGGNKMLLRRYLEEGLRLVLDHLETMAQPLEGQEQLAQVAETICHDSGLARLLGEIFDIIGEYGQLDIQPGQGRELEREYVEGIHWDAGLLSRYFLPGNNNQRVELENAYLLMTDLEIEDARDLVPVLDQVAQRDSKGLMIVARKLSEQAIGYLYQINHAADNLKVVAVKTPFVSADDQQAALADMALLVGGQVVTQTSGQTLAGVTVKDLGRARRAWADLDHFGIIGGKGDARLLRQHLASLQAYHARAKDPQERRKLQQRVGRLLGGSAVLHAGGMTEMEIETRKEQAERTASALRAAVGSGLLPGGGAALLDCREALKGPSGAKEPIEKRVAFRILSRSLEEPFRTILANAGLEAQDWLAELRLVRSGHGVDVRSGRIVNMFEAGILDSAAVVKAALHSAVSTAALALTIDVFVHRRIVPESVNP